jgi:predicted phage-related endonuclease
MESRIEKEAQCYNELKDMINNTWLDLNNIIHQGNPHNLPDPKLQLQITNYLIATIRELENKNGLQYDNKSDNQLITL